MSQFATAAELRSYLDVASTTGRASDTNLNLMLQAASDFLERATGRIIASSPSNTQRTFSTMGRAAMTIPDLRTVSAASLQGTTLTADSTYWLIPSRQQPVSGDPIYTGIQLHAYSRWDYRANPEWFDRNLDQWRWQGGYSLPNDLVITGLWGWTTTPSQWKFATIALASYYYQHADALFSGARATPEGNIFDLSALPSEVRELVADWAIGEQAALV